MLNNKATRGYGFLENLLSRRRAQVANYLILDYHRKGRVLDIGCGSTPYFLTNTKFVQKYGLDPSLKKMEGFGNLKLQRFDVEKNLKLPFKENFFEVVTLLAVIEHIEPDRIKCLLKEIRRVMKPRGRLILTTPTPFANKLLRIMSVLKLTSTKEVEEHKLIFSRELLSEYLNSSGFHKKNVRTGYFEFFLNIYARADKE